MRDATATNELRTLQLASFLDDNNALDGFIVALDDHIQELKDTGASQRTISLSKSPTNIICAFRWKKTKEGFDFWSSLNSQQRDEVDDDESSFYIDAIEL